MYLNYKKKVVKKKILPTDLNISRGSNKKGKLNIHLPRGMFKNHIKLGIKGIKLNEILIKYCNPKN